MKGGKIVKKLAVFLLIGMLMFLIGMLIYLYAFKAPIASGKIVYHQEYKPGFNLDIYKPTNSMKEKSPVLIFFHGGAWIAGMKESINGNRFHGAINELRDNGYTLISPTYTLARNGESPFPNCIEDAFDVVKWVKSNAEVYNFDTTNIGVMGESAGGHIALMLAYARSNDFPQIALPINYVVDVYAPSDLSKLSQSPILDSMNTYLSNVPSNISKQLDIVQYLVGFDPESDSTRLANFLDFYSPSKYVNSSIPPTLIIHGAKDRVVPIEQSINLKVILDSSSVQNTLHIIENTDHAFFGANRQQKDEVQRLIAKFVLEHKQ